MARAREVEALPGERNPSTGLETLSVRGIAGESERERDGEDGDFFFFLERERERAFKERERGEKN